MVNKAVKKHKYMRQIHRNSDMINKIENLFDSPAPCFGFAIYSKMPMEMIANV